MVFILSFYVFGFLSPVAFDRRLFVTWRRRLLPDHTAWKPDAQNKYSK
jgi:hypothetical protein